MPQHPGFSRRAGSKHIVGLRGTIVALIRFIHSLIGYIRGYTIKLNTNIHKKYQLRITTLTIFIVCHDFPRKNLYKPYSPDAHLRE